MGKEEQRNLIHIQGREMNEPEADVYIYHKCSISLAAEYFEAYSLLCV